MTIFRRRRAKAHWQLAILLAIALAIWGAVAESPAAQKSPGARPPLIFPVGVLPEGGVPIVFQNGSARWGVGDERPQLRAPVDAEDAGSTIVLMPMGEGLGPERLGDRDESGNLVAYQDHGRFSWMWRTIRRLWSPRMNRATARFNGVRFDPLRIEPWQFDSRYLDYGLDFYGYNGSNARYNFGPSLASEMQAMLANATRSADLPPRPITVVDPLSPSLPYFNAQRPTLLFFHGWSPGGIERMNKSTFNMARTFADVPPPFVLDVELADLWLDRGWNAARFMWSSFSDEKSVFALEQKVMDSSVAPRYHVLEQVGSGANVSARIVPHRLPVAMSVSDLAVMELTSAFGTTTRLGVAAGVPRSEWPELRIACTSAGCQPAIWSQYLILKRYGPKAGALAHRLALIEPWASDRRMCVFPRFCGAAFQNQTTGETLEDKLEMAIAALRSAGVAIEFYMASRTCSVMRYALAGGSCLRTAQDNTAYARLRFRGKEYLPSRWNPQSATRIQHIIGAEWYMRSIQYPPPLIVHGVQTLGDVNQQLRAWGISPDHVLGTAEHVAIASGSGDVSTRLYRMVFRTSDAAKARSIAAESAAVPDLQAPPSAPGISGPIASQLAPRFYRLPAEDAVPNVARPLPVVSRVGALLDQSEFNGASLRRARRFHRRQVPVQFALQLESWTPYNFTFLASPLVLGAVEKMAACQTSLRACPDFTTISPVSSCVNALLTSVFPWLTSRQRSQLTGPLSELAFPGLSASTPTSVVRRLAGTRLQQRTGFYTRDFARFSYDLLPSTMG